MILIYKKLSWDFTDLVSGGTEVEEDEDGLGREDVLVEPQESLLDLRIRQLQPSQHDR
jgi:hypothetical protein